MFIAARFTIARTWKQPKCPSTDEWIKKMWHIYTMEYYSAIKRNEKKTLGKGPHFAFMWNLTLDRYTYTIRIHIHIHIRYTWIHRYTYIHIRYTYIDTE